MTGSASAAAGSPLRVALERNDSFLHLTLARPKANIVDAAMLNALGNALARHREWRGLRGVLLDADGPHFSFGASVEEHLKERCAEMLATLHALINFMVEYPVPILVAVKGQCLGGGLEVVMAGGPIFASPDAQFGQPEIRLGVFAPAASVLLPYRVNQPAAEDLLFSGRSIGAEEAKAIGLVQQIDEDPVAAARTWFETQLADKSASSLRLALEAVRGAMRRDVRSRLAEVEKLYVEQLMNTTDANEGLAAFLEKRKPFWEHH